MSANVLENYIVRSITLGIEVTEVATGAVRTMKVEDAGLTLDAEAQLPKTLDLPPPTAYSHSKYDRWQDRLLLAAPAVPVIIWGVYHLFRRQRPQKSPGG